MEDDEDKILDDKYIIINDDFSCGGTAVVQIVQGKLSGLLYAAKVYNEPDKISKYINNEINILKFITEKKIPYIINYVGDGQGPITGPKSEKNEDKKYLILELASKGELVNYIYYSEKGFTETFSKVISRDILESIKALHSMGICHRDIKTDNVILDDNFNPKLCDFGYSIHYKDINNIKPNKQSIGDKKFIPPQMHNKQPYNAFKAEIFNFGVLLFYLVTGKFGFESSANSNEKYNCIKEHKFEEYWNILDADEKIKTNIKNLSPEFKKLYCKIVSYNEDERPSIDQILNDDWFKEIRDMDSKQYEELRNKLIIEFSKREDIYIKKSQKEAETDKDDETTPGYSNLDDECIKKEYFNSSLTPQRISSKKIKNMKHFIKIVGNLKPDIFMNYLANKLASKEIYEIQESNDDTLEFDITNENEDEENEDNDNDINSDNEEDEEELEYISQKKLTIQLKLFETEKKEFILRFMKKSGRLDDYYKALEEIMKEAESLL